MHPVARILRCRCHQGLSVLDRVTSPRAQLRDVPGADAPVFHHAQRQQTVIDSRTRRPRKAKEVLEENDQVLGCVWSRNFGPGALDRMGFSWERIQALNPKMIMASVKGFSEGHSYEDLKVLRKCPRSAPAAPRLPPDSGTALPRFSAAALGDSKHRHAPRHRYF